MTQIIPANLVESITLYPGSGEYIYEIYPIKAYGVDINIRNDKNEANVVLSIKQLKKTFPNLKNIGVIVDWFSTSLDAGAAKIIPKVESNDKEIDWQVGVYTRKTAEPVNFFDNGEITFGGTPTDRSIVQLCGFLKQQDLKIMLLPRLMVDDESLTKPWRGNIKPIGHKLTYEISVTNFFKGKEGYNKFILHYANLEYNKVKLKDIIDIFVIGSELKDLTSIKVNDYLYPTINHLKDLAKLVKNIVGEKVKLTYSANWGEYNLAYMDKLWCDPHINYVGISAYFPLTDNLPQNQITFEKIKNGWHSGEGFDYYYDKNKKISYNDPAWAWKNIEHWWKSFHPGKTCWNPKQKPIIFTEYGFSSIEGTSNKPYYYFDDRSGGQPPEPNNYAQGLAIAASESFFIEKNQQDPNFLPLRFLYAWDARPYPFFPEDCDYWSDCGQYPYSHSVNGKIEDVVITISENPSEL